MSVFCFRPAKIITVALLHMSMYDLTETIILVGQKLAEKCHEICQYRTYVELI